MNQAVRCILTSPPHYLWQPRVSTGEDGPEYTEIVCGIQEDGKMRGEWWKQGRAFLKQGLDLQTQGIVCVCVCVCVSTSTGCYLDSFSTWVWG